VGLTYSDNALFGKDDSSAVPMGGSLRSHTDRIRSFPQDSWCSNFKNKQFHSVKRMIRGTWDFGPEPILKL